MDSLIFLLPQSSVGWPANTRPSAERHLLYLFEDCALDTDRRELRRGVRLVPVEPQVFDLLQYLIWNRERVVSKDDLIASIWGGRIVSESALATRINAARSAKSRVSRPVRARVREDRFTPVPR